MAVYYQNKSILRKIGLRVLTSVYENSGDFESIKPDTYYDRRNYFLRGQFLLRSKFAEFDDVTIDTPATVWPFPDKKQLRAFDSIALSNDTSCYCIVPLSNRVLSHVELSVQKDVNFTTEIGMLYIISVPSIINNISMPEHTLIAPMENPSLIVPQQNGKVVVIEAKTVKIKSL